MSESLPQNGTVIVLVSTAFLNTLYHVAVPERAPWVENLPGTLLAFGRLDTSG